MLVRAAEQAKTERKHTLWFTAWDEPENLRQIAKTPARVKAQLQSFL